MYLEKVQRSARPKARRVLAYGTHGVGKTTWASRWPSPVFLPIEDGCGDLGVSAFPQPRTLDEVWGPIVELSGGGHEYKTLVIDSMDWLEQIVWAEVCKRHGQPTIASFSYGKGYAFAAEVVKKLLAALTQARDAGIHVLLIAHADIRKFSDPGLETYDRYFPKLHATVSGLVQEWADEVLFFGYKRFIRNEKVGFDSQRGIAIGNERRIFTEEQPGFVAKNRLGLPPEMTLEFEQFSVFI